jgi:type VI secretion system protein
MERLARAVRERDREHPSPVGGGGDARAGFEAFCRGAGLDPAKLPEGNATAMLQVAGRLLHEALIGLKSLDAKQTEFRRQFRLPPVRDEDTQPFKLASTTDELLQSMFVSHDSRRRDAGQFLRACFEQQTSHQEALGIGTRVGFTEFLRQLAPAELERRFAHAPKRVAPGAPKPNIWELYAEFYRIASEVHADTGVPSLYAETLANAYTAALKKP